eukprot:scaffold838_cov218-Chaetoceros_neogracile.AAC.12
MAMAMMMESFENTSLRALQYLRGKSHNKKIVSTEKLQTSSMHAGGVIQLCRKIITRVTSKINSAAGFCVELRRLSTKKVTNVISGEL